MYVIYLVIPLAPLVYWFLKWRLYRDGMQPDPELGKKVIVYYFKTLGYQLALIGLTMMIFGLLSRRGDEQLKMGLGFLIGGGLVYLLLVMAIYAKVVGDNTHLVARMYTGINLLIVGLIFIIAFTAFWVILFTASFKAAKLPLSAFIVYAGALVGEGFYFIGRR
jgi:hypothetical protein